MNTPTPDTTMADLRSAWPAARSVLARRGMACVGCAMAAFQTIAEAADAYGFEAAAFIRDVMTRSEADPAAPPGLAAAQRQRRAFRRSFR